MLDAQARACSLTRAQKKVLADLDLFSDGKEVVAISVRKLSETAGVDVKTVLRAIQRLNELQLIRTYIPPRPGVSEHRLTTDGRVRTGDVGIHSAARRTSAGGRS